MELRIRDLLGIEAATVELRPGEVVEVLGPNAAGKTSLAVCAQAVLAREPNPLHLSAGEARRGYLREGEDPGEAVLVAEGDHQVAWRPVDIEAPAQPPHDRPAACPEAVGLVDFAARRSAREQAALFQSVLLPPAEEVEAQVRARLGEHLDPGDIAGVMDTARQRGWKAAATIYDDRARESKRQWEQTATRRYGSKVASDWRPAGWTADDDALTAVEAAAAVVEARDELAALHRVEAATAAELQAAEEASLQLPALEEAVEQAAAGIHGPNGDLAEANAALADRRSRRQELRRAIEQLQGWLGPKTHACPHCDRLIIVTSDGIEAADAASADAELQKRKQSLATLRAEAEQLDGAIRSAEQRSHALRDDVAVAARRLDDARVAVRLAQGRAAVAGREVDTDERRRRLAAAEEGVERAKASAARVTARDRAAELHATILRYAAVATALGPRGVRQQLLAAGLGRLNAGLAQLSGRAQWPAVAVSADSGAVSIGGRPAVLCSESERWRGQALIQLTIGALTEARAVVLDRGDLLDERSRAGLQTLAKAAGATGIAVLLCSSDMPHTRDTRWRQVRIEDGRMA